MPGFFGRGIHRWAHPLPQVRSAWGVTKAALDWLKYGFYPAEIKYVTVLTPRAARHFLTTCLPGGLHLPGVYDKQPGSTEVFFAEADGRGLVTLPE